MAGELHIATLKVTLIIDAPLTAFRTAPCIWYFRTKGCALGMEQKHLQIQLSLCLFPFLLSEKIPAWATA